MDRFGLPYFGDVAAYVRAEAATVEKRALIRSRGLKLLKRLMMDDTYDRIVLVSHSLGSMIAYDLLQILWADFRPRKLEAIRDKAKLKAIHAIDKATLVAGSAWPGSLDDLAGFRRHQWELYRQLRTKDDNHGPWKISDFVTLGSPLTHSEFLVTHNLAEFRRGIAERLFSACPPVAEGAAAGGTVLYQEGRNRSSGKPQRAVHHGAVFAATRWTNIFDRGNGWLTGDPISGPMAENFGPGVENIQVELRGCLGRVFTHTLYWSLTATGVEVGDRPRLHLAVLRDAVDLGRKLEPSQAEAPTIPPRK
ncbi:hypothetical protein [Mesorhizobium sp. M0227]|uniref:hypothetical protein n=1 Tax=unclassified Mesorhizobium TaxID=325217 RepID=UPI003337DE86